MKAKDTLSTYKHLTLMLDTNSKVYYSRFGDGDFYIMNGKREMMHSWSAELAKELYEAFTINDPLFLRGAMVNYPVESGMTDGVFAPPTDNKQIANWLEFNQKIPNDTEFESHVMFPYIAVFKQELMINFLDKYIRPKKKMFIGCVDKNSIEKLIGPVDYYVNVPAKDAYYSIDKWYPDIINNIDDVEVCIPVAGMATRVIQKRLWKLNKNLHAIDLGSVVDAVSNNQTRTWIKRVGFDRVKNLIIK